MNAASTDCAVAELPDRQSLVIACDGEPDGQNVPTTEAEPDSVLDALRKLDFQIAQPHWGINE